MGARREEERWARRGPDVARELELQAEGEEATRRARPQGGKVAADPVLRARVLADLKRSRTPRQIAGRSHLEAGDDTVGC